MSRRPSKMPPLKWDAISACGTGASGSVGKRERDGRPLLGKNQKTLIAGVWCINKGEVR